MGQPGTLALWFWGIGQATGIGLATWCLLAMGTRLAPAARARLAVCALWLMGCAPALMLLPIDGFGLGGAHSSAGNESAAVATAATTDPIGQSAAVDWNEVLLSAADWFVVAVDQSTAATETEPGGWSWTTWLVCAIAGCMAYGCLRIIGGMWQLHAIRAHARPCTDRRLLAIGDECAVALGLQTPVQWLQHSAIGTPAVVGLVRPAVIFPEECCFWKDEQVRCAFAHELAHVKRHDVLTTLLGQIALALNYFHPVGHLLIGRMRLDQELAADCLAAPIVGGQRVYLETLAALALQRPHARTGGPALAFLPTRRTFVRRLEMLRTLRLVSSQATHWQTIVLPMCILCLAFAAMIVRPTSAQTRGEGQSKPGVPATSAAQQGATATASNPEQSAAGQPADSMPELLNYVPDSAAAGVLIVDVEKMLQTKPLSDLVAQLPPDQRTLTLPFGKLNIEDVERAMLIISGVDRQSDALVAIRFKPGKPIPQPAKPGDPQSRSYGFAMPLAALDARTILVGPKADELKPLLLLALAGGDRGDLKDLVRRHSDSSVRAALRVAALRPVIGRNAANVSYLAPLWRDVSTASMGLQIGERLEFTATLDSSQPTAVRETLEAVKTLGRNALNSAWDSESSPVRASKDVMLFQMARDIGNSVLSNVVITEQPGSVQVATHWDQPTPALLGLILPAMKDARASARRAQEINSLRQIALALHNYHDAYGHFPPAIVIENGVGRSWRVELLPFLEQAALYNQYRKDEPWDSPNNKRLGMTQIPVYAPLTVSTGAPFDPSLTPVRGIGGESGILGKVGHKLLDITDGTSNTLMVVRAGDMVPWTKPEEYAPTPEELIQAAQQTDGLLAALADGSVRVLSSSIDPKVLKALMTINGQEAYGVVP